MFNPAAEAMPLPELHSLQLARLRETVQRLHDRVPAYRAKFEQAGVSPGDLKTLQDLPRFPFTRKDDLRAGYPFGLLSVPRGELRRIHASSGTSGKATVVGYDAHDLDIFSEVVARSLYAAGARPGMLFHNAYGYGLFTGGLGTHAGAERLGMGVVPMSGGNTTRQVELIEDFGPEVIACTPSYGLVLAEALKKRGHTPDTISLKYAVLGAEPWSEAMRREVETGLGLKATNIYGLSEIIGPGISNEDVREQRGSHLWEDHFYPEIVNPQTGESLPDGEPGVLVLTSTAMPLLRYWTGDVTRLLPPSGGRSVRRMDMIQGRSDDMIVLRGVNVYPSQIEAALTGLEGLSPHYLLVRSRSGLLDELCLRVESVRQDAAMRAEVVRVIKERVGVTVICELCGAGSLPRSEGGKLRRVQDLRGER